jgi:hypothetical protein
MDIGVLMYSWLLAIGMRIFRPGIRTEFALVRAVNFLVFFAAVYTFSVYWRALADWRTRTNDLNSRRYSLYLDSPRILAVHRKFCLVCGCRQPRHFGGCHCFCNLPLCCLSSTITFHTALSLTHRSADCWRLAIRRRLFCFILRCSSWARQ